MSLTREQDCIACISPGLQYQMDRADKAEAESAAKDARIAALEQERDMWEKVAAMYYLTDSIDMGDYTRIRTDEYDACGEAYEEAYDEAAKEGEAK